MRGVMQERWKAKRAVEHERREAARKVASVVNSAVDLRDVVKPEGANRRKRWAAGGALAGLVLGLLAGRAVAQDRSEGFRRAAVQVTTLQLWPLADGGCEARACGEVRGDAGTVVRECEGPFALRAAINQSRCAALLGAVEGRVAGALRFAGDGGAP